MQGAWRGNNRVGITTKKGRLVAAARTPVLTQGRERGRGTKGGLGKSHRPHRKLCPHPRQERLEEEQRITITTLRELWPPLAELWLERKNKESLS